MTKTKKIANIIASIILVLTIILTMLSGICRFTLTNKTIYLNLLEKSNTYSIIKDELYKKMSAILGEDISEDLKKSIITEEDVRKEADVVLDCMISDLISGQADIPEIDTSIYKERIADALKSLAGYERISSNDTNLTSNIQDEDLSVRPVKLSIENTNLIGENMIVSSNLNKKNDQQFYIINLATRQELEAKGRAILKEKGITEAEARQKAAEKGITEDDVWNYLRESGYLDEEQESERQENNSEHNESSNEVYNNSDLEAEIKSETVISDTSTSDSNDENKISKNKIQKIVTSVLMDKSKNFHEKVEEISLRLMEEAEKIIDNEMEKLNFSKIINSDKFITLVKIISILYTYFYMFLLLNILICIVLILINKNSVEKSIIIIGTSLLTSGIFMSLIFGFIYLSKIYGKINIINFNKAYFEPIYLECAEYFSRVSCLVSITIFLLGLVFNIFMMKKKLTRR